MYFARIHVLRFDYNTSLSHPSCKDEFGDTQPFQYVVLSNYSSWQSDNTNYLVLN